MASLPEEEHPFTDRELKEDSFPKSRWCQGKVQEDERADQTSELCHQVIAQLSNNEQVEQTKTGGENSLPLFGSIECKHRMFDRSLCPTLSPSKSLFPECLPSDWCQFIGHYIEVMDSSQSSTTGAKS